jgi:predicted Rossmann fold flavoprotein
VDLLQRECEAAGVNIRLNCIVQEVRKPLSFEVATNLGTYTSDALVIATGGLSFAKLGATDFGYRIARQFGLNLIEPRPGLVPLTFRTDDQQTFAALSGISVDASVSHDGAIFRENILFTHRGLSGPAILQISNYCPPGRPFHIDLLPGRSALELLDAHRQSGKELKTVLAQQLPARFTQAWCERFAPSRPMHRYSNAELESIARELQRWELAAAETEGYPKAEVTLGGVDTNELSSKTMESRHVTGLFFIGEVVDVTGWLGGYNFQWAWASAHAAGGAV